MAISLHVSSWLSAEPVCTATVYRSWTVEHAKARIERIEGTPRISQRLFHASRLLLDSEILGDLCRDERCHDQEEQRSEENRPLGNGPRLRRSIRLDLALVRTDPKWAATLRDVEDGWLELKDAGEAHRADPAIVTAAVAANGSALQHASEDVRRNRYVVLAACRSSGSALRHASEELRADQEVVLTAVKGTPVALRYADERLWRDRKFALEAVRLHGSALLYVPELLRLDKELVIAAVRNDPAALQHAPEAFQDDPEIRQACRLHGLRRCRTGDEVKMGRVRRRACAA